MDKSNVKTGNLGLLLWAQKITREYGLKVENFTTHWKDGRAYCAIINYFFPDELDYDQISTDTEEQILKNHQQAFDIAEKHNVFKILDPEDMLTPDRQSIMAYLAKWYHEFKDLQRGVPSDKEKKAQVLMSNEYSDIVETLKDTLKQKLEEEKLDLQSKVQQTVIETSLQQEPEKQQKEEQEQPQKEKEEKERQERIQKEQEQERIQKEQEQQRQQEQERLQKEEQEKRQREQQRQEQERIQREERERQETLQRKRQEQESQQQQTTSQPEKPETVTTQNPTRVSFDPKLLLIFFYLFISHFLVSYLLSLLFSPYTYVALATLYGVRRFNPQMDLLTPLATMLPNLRTLVHFLDSGIHDLSLFVRDLLLAKKMEKVLAPVQNVLQMIHARLIQPLAHALGLQTSCWSLFVLLYPRVLFTVIGWIF